MKLATPFIAAAWLCALTAAVALPLTALAAEPMEVQVDVTPQTQPAAVEGEEDAAPVPAKVTITQRFQPPSEDAVAKWRDFILAVLAALVAVLTFVAVVLVPAFLKLRESVTASAAKTDAQNHRIDRLGDNVNQVMRDMPPTAPPSEVFPKQ